MMQALSWLSVPGLDLAAGTMTVSLWVAGILAIVLLLLMVLAILRAGLTVVLGSLVGVGLVATAAVTAVAMVNRHDRAEERRALDRRIGTLTASATVPGSMLGCLDADIGDAVEGSCEKVVFANPEGVAAATAFVSARLALLIDGLDFANRSDPTYEGELDGVRRAVEADRFGFVAQVLASRDGCTPAKCEVFQWLHDATRIRANLNERTLDTLVARNSAGWPVRSHSAAPVAAASPSSAPPVGAPTGMTFPSAASIPPVSIMNNEPPATTPPAAAATTPARKPAPPRTAQQPRAQANPPVPITPAAPTAATTPRP